MEQIHIGSHKDLFPGWCSYVLIITVWYKKDIQCRKIIHWESLTSPSYCKKSFQINFRNCILSFYRKWSIKCPKYQIIFSNWRILRKFPASFHWCLQSYKLKNKENKPADFQLMLIWIAIFSRGRGKKKSLLSV